MPPGNPDPRASQLVAEFRASLEKIFGRERLDADTAPACYNGANTLLVEWTGEYAAINGVGPGLPPRPRRLSALVEYQLERHAESLAGE